MKVKDLIKKLQEYDGESDVVVTYECLDPYFGCSEKDLGEFEFSHPHRRLEVKEPGKRKPIESWVEDTTVLEISYHEYI